MELKLLSASMIAFCNKRTINNSQSPEWEQYTVINDNALIINNCAHLHNQKPILRFTRVFFPLVLTLLRDLTITNKK